MEVVGVVADVRSIDLARSRRPSSCIAGGDPRATSSWCA
jgi:hypothetical protein